MKEFLILVDLSNQIILIIIVKHAVAIRCTDLLKYFIRTHKYCLIELHDCEPYGEVSSLFSDMFRTKKDTLYQNGNPIIRTLVSWYHRAAMAGKAPKA